MMHLFSSHAGNRQMPVPPSCATGCSSVSACPAESANRTCCPQSPRRDIGSARVTVAFKPSAQTRLRHHLGVMLEATRTAECPPTNEACLREAIAALSDAIDQPRCGFEELAQLARQVAFTRDQMRTSLEPSRLKITAMFAEAHKRELMAQRF